MCKVSVEGGWGVCEMCGGWRGISLPMTVCVCVCVCDVLLMS